MKVSQVDYVKMLKRFNMADPKLVNVPLEGHFKLSKTQILSTKDEKALMSEVTYALAVGSLMYVMTCTRRDIAQAVGVVSKYMSSSEKETLESCEVDSEISEGQFRYNTVLWRYESSAAGIY